MSRTARAACTRFAFLIAAMCLLIRPAALASDMGHAAADQVSEFSYIDFMDNWLFTHVGDNRGPSGPDLVPCRDNIAFLMESYGLDVELESFTYFGSTYHNVVGTKVGSVHPDQEYIIGAHYDSVSNPGADDNASGVALVLECARILGQYESEYTIRFVAFSMEEVGLVGSEAYVAAHANDDILGMISADMVAYDPGTNNCNVYGRTSSNPIKTTLAAAIAEYGDGLNAIVGGDTPYSDHAPFEEAGLQACLLIEGEVWSNPYYHQSSDNFENPNNLNFPYAVKMTRSIAGWLVDQANVIVDIDTLRFQFPDGLPETVAPSGGATVRVDVSGLGQTTPLAGSGKLHYNTGAGWQSTPMAQLAPNSYEAVFPAATCGENVAFYFSAQSTEGDTFTSPSSAPTPSYTALASFGMVAFFEEDLAVDPGWSTQGLWSFGQPTGGGGQYGCDDPTLGFTGPNVYGYNLFGDYENSLPERHLTTGAIDCTGQSDVAVRFRRWLGVEQPSYDHAYLRVSNDGVNWHTVWENAAEIEDGAWTLQEYDISDYADDQPAVYLRWTMGTTDSLWQYCGWNIDDVQLLAIDCGAPCPADLTDDADVNADDLFDLLGAWGACGGCPQDLTGDDIVNADDLFELLGAWGPCP